MRLGQVKAMLLSAVQRIEAQIALASDRHDSATVSAPTSSVSVSQQSPLPSGLGSTVVTAIRDANVPVPSKFAALALTVHVILLELGFVCNGADAADRSLPGFAALARGQRPLS
jgi:hypothetical protein